MDGLNALSNLTYPALDRTMLAFKAGWPATCRLFSFFPLIRRASFVSHSVSDPFKAGSACEHATL